ncbi:MAG: DUF3324 domain-containing protein [Gammaproteobacteria bacterium]|nr:DUF3324 domain-containing protein [Gammaproteobacteria bacterium]MDH5226911.1 DUF3324 domain-containing protein [Gammaproteobacteria bacterium]
MSASGRTPTRSGRKKAARKPPPHWRKYLTQAELELPPPPASGLLEGPGADTDREYESFEDFEPAWWQRPVFVAALGAACVGLLVVTAVSLLNAARDRAAAEQALAREQVLTLRAINNVRALRIAPNPRSWSKSPDVTIDWPEPPQLLELHLPVGYSEFLTFAIVIDKVDQGRVMVVERIAPDSNKDLLLSLNSSAFGPGEYRLRLQGYTWRGERVDVGWVRLVVAAPRA